MTLAIGGCGGGGSESPDQLSAGGELAAHLPADGALNIAVVDVDAIRRSLGLKPGSAPPTGSESNDVAFYNETNPALLAMRSEMPPAITTALLAKAHAIASVSGDQAATAISTGAGASESEGLLRSAGMTEEGSAFVSADGGFAIAVSGGLIGIAADAGDARSIVEDPTGDVPSSLAQVDGDGELVTLARFGARCLESIATSDSVDEPGQVVFFTTATPDPARVRSTLQRPTQPRVVGDSVRVAIPAAVDARVGPPALRALSDHRVDYDCGS